MWGFACFTKNIPIRVTAVLLISNTIQSLYELFNYSRLAWGKAGLGRNQNHDLDYVMF